MPPTKLETSVNASYSGKKMLLFTSMHLHPPTSHVNWAIMHNNGNYDIFI